MSSATDWMTAIGTVVAAASAFIAAVISAYAVATWRNGLKQQRADDLVAAVHDCAASIGRTVSRKRNKQNPSNDGLGLDRAWSSWARVRTALEVARRYFPRLEGDFAGRGEAILERLSSYCVTGTGSEGINAEFGSLRDAIMSKLH